ncbi:MAG: metallophosphoesterase [Actinobacteria bacterium]|nr:metallophosphoesterase [Actinomycetota bacterium]
MLLVADVHGNFDALARVARRGEALVVLGDLLNLVDYRSGEGLLADLLGRDLVLEVLEQRRRAGHGAARERWRAFVAGREEETRARFESLVEAVYTDLARALEGADAYVTYGNTDHPDLLRRCLPAGVRYVDGDVVEIEGRRVGIVGGGPSRLGVPGEVPEESLAARLAGLGAVDVLCTHAAPAVAPLSRDVIGGRSKGSPAILDYLLACRPARHYFGDVHQPQALSWRVGDTLCCNVGFFRLTGRAVRLG